MKLEKISSHSLFSSGMCGIDTYRIPAVITLPGGRIIAFAEARKNSISDAGEIDIVCRVSNNGGKTFGRVRTIVRGNGGTAGNPCPVYDKKNKRILLLFNRNTALGDESEIFRNNAPRTVHLVTSDNLGRTFSHERDITATTKKPDWTWYATAPGHGLYLENGRIVIPCNHGLLLARENAKREYSAHIIYSDDGGQSWAIGADVGGNTNESTAAALPDGRVILNMRVIDGEKFRAIAQSADGGENYSKTEPVCTSLPAPSCEGSMLAYKDRLIFSAPSYVPFRKGLCLYSSRDGFEWKKEKILCEEFSAYSDITLIRDGSLGVLYEASDKSGREYTSIVFDTYGIYD